MNKKTYVLPIAVFVIILLLTSLACSLPFSGSDSGDDAGAGSAVEFGADDDDESDNDSEMEAADSDDNTEMEDSDDPEMPSDSDADADSDQTAEIFPMTDDADILIQDGTSATYGTKLSIDETVAFYRAEFDKLGFTERDLLTNIMDDSFSMVFDGHHSGLAILVQGTDFGDSTTISIQFQDI